MPRLLFEIGCEELPASTCRAALVQLPDLCKRHLDVTPTEVLVGPRRLALTAELPLEVRSQRVDGPPEHIAFDDAGRPTKAGDGFARKVGVPVQELDVVGGVLTFSPDPVSGASFAEERLGALVADFFVAKPMVWDRTRFPFSRPIRWLCAKLGKETLHVEIAGVRSGSASFGHRFAYGSIDIPAAELYADTLRAAGVEPSAEARRSAIVAGLDALGGWTDPAGVLEEVVHLVESVRVLEGSGDPKYLELPERVIVSAMQAHQRYFPLGGVRFAFVANGGDDAVVAAGNEQVLEGRLEDASFTY
ncbi:MAG: glycine--tRNA ligase subunit beta, partial [Gaiellales bacterium]